jgi:uncharacterized C2H2 Zn-finger protein
MMLPEALAVATRSSAAVVTATNCGATLREREGAAPQQAPTSATDDQDSNPVVTRLDSDLAPPVQLNQWPVPFDPEALRLTCPKCRVAMKEQRGIYHGKRKFKCPRCGKVRMQRHRKR